MATLVLSTVGNALGGPVGGAIGALIGQSIDQQLLGPATKGPRLGDLKVQSSSYGTQIPRVYGTMRVAGTVVWATDLVESGETSGAKGQPDTTYSYAVSMAVAIASRPVQGIGRIWADGKLLRGADGDFKVDTKFRFYGGGADQEVDPLIASAEGIANTPAYRDLALTVFEDLQLADFGNRIPFLTFEVIADEALTVGAVVEDASAGLIRTSDPREMVGYAAYGQSVQAALQPLIDGFAIDLFDDGMRLASAGGLPIEIGSDELGNSADHQKVARIQREQVAATSLPSVLRLGYYDRVLDFQSGEARASSADRRGTEEQHELPAALTAADAKSLAQSMIAREWARRDKLTLRLPPRHLALQPGDEVALNLSPRRWRVEQVTIDSYVVVAELRPAWTAARAIAADAGRIARNPDLPAADVSLALFDIPDVLEQGSATPIVLLAASSPSHTWKSHAVELSAGQQILQVQTARRKTFLGTATTVLGAGDASLIDDVNSFDVKLIDPEQWLVSCDDDAIAEGGNLAVLGSEVLQFGRAEPIGAGAFRLSHLVRGRAGTEWAMSLHSIGEPFAMIARDTLQSVSLPSWSLGATVAASIGVSSCTPMIVNAEGLRPVAPVHLNASIDSAGNLVLSWTRRSRNGFAWNDEVDVPLGESSELYRVRISGAGGSVELPVTEPSLQVPSADLAPIGVGPISIEVRQVGDTCASKPARTMIN